MLNNGVYTEIDECGKEWIFPDAALTSQDSHRWMNMGTGEFDEIVHLIYNRRLALDVGAFCGVWTCSLARIFHQVIAFEPSYKAIPCFQYNTVGLNNVQLIKMAVLHSRGLTRATYNAMGGIYFTGQPDNAMAIEITSIDHMNLPVLDFIKTDTDGQEDKVILGAKDTIAKFKPLIFIEIKHNDIGAKLLKEWGYESIHESDNHMNLLMKHKDN